MTTLPPHLEALGSELARVAGARAAAYRRRRRLQAVALVATTLLVMTGVGLGASGVDLVGWLASDDDPSSVRYLVDTTRTYSGPAPKKIECDDVRRAEFLCRPLPTEYTCEQVGKQPYPCGELGPSQRVYWLEQRVERGPRIDRALLVETIQDLRGDGMPARVADRFADAAQSVSDDFIARVDLLMSVGWNRTYRERPDGTTAVPPAGVPLKVTCEDAPGRLVRCRNVEGVTDVPLGAPIYGLEPTADWVPAGPGETVEEHWAEIESFFGRPFQDDEMLLFTLLSLGGEMSPEEWAAFEDALDRAGLLD